jgi:hypothetical protein
MREVAGSTPGLDFRISMVLVYTVQSLLSRSGITDGATLSVMNFTIENKVLDYQYMTGGIQ